MLNLFVFSLRLEQLGCWCVKNGYVMIGAKKRVSLIPRVEKIGMLLSVRNLRKKEKNGHSIDCKAIATPRVREQHRM